MFKIPDTRKQIFDKLAADVQNTLPNSNPQKEKSWLRSILSGFSGAFFDLYFQLQEAVNTFFADTTYGVFLERKASNNGISRNAATGSTGNIIFTGTATTVISAGTLLNGVSNAVEYQTLTNKTILAETLNVSLLTFSSNIAIVTITIDHDLAVGVSITIAGATPSGLNGTFAVASVTGDQVFTYATTEAGSGTATGTITTDVTRAVTDVESNSVGIDTNLNLGESLTLQTPIAGADNTALVTFDALGGGADIETDASLRARLIFKLQNPVTLFNAIQITVTLKELSFVDRVFVEEITPTVGQVTIYLLKENNVLPSASEITQAEDKIEETILPANTSISDVFISAPSEIVVAFTFSALDPNTATMQTSITNKLQEFFNNDTDIGVDITEDQYRCAIQSTIDSATGELITSFTLSTPTGDITIASGEIGVLGSMTYP